MITPSNGRIVWFEPPVDPANRSGVVQHDVKQPLAAQICHVWNERMVNLLVTDSAGQQQALTSVVLLQDDDLKPAEGRFAFWMPYQKGQAAKTDAAEAATKKDPAQ